MDSSPDLRTSFTLLGRLSGPVPDQRSWAEFVHRYGPMVYRWCQQWQLQEADAQDVTQNVLARLVVRLREFKYDRERSFRAYLRSVARYAWRDHLAERGAGDAGSGDTGHLEMMHQVEAREDLALRLEAEFDREILEHAFARVRGRVEPNTWEAFCLTAQDGLPGAVVAERLGLGVYSVYKARSRVQEMLKIEVAALESAGLAGAHR